VEAWAEKGLGRLAFTRRLPAQRAEKSACLLSTLMRVQKCLVERARLEKDLLAALECHETPAEQFRTFETQADEINAPRDQEYAGKPLLDA